MKTSNILSHSSTQQLGSPHSSRRTTLALLAGICLLLGLHPNDVQGATVTYIGGDGIWTQPDFNSFSPVPYNSGDNVEFTLSIIPSDTLYVTLSGFLTPGSVLVKNSPVYDDGSIVFSGNGTIAGNASLTVNLTSGHPSITQVFENNCNLIYTGGTVINNKNSTTKLLRMNGPAAKLGNGSVVINHLSFGARRTVFEMNSGANLTNNVFVNSFEPTASRIDIFSNSNATHSANIDFNGSYMYHFSGNNTNVDFTGDIIFGGTTAFGLLQFTTQNETINMPSTTNIIGKISNRSPSSLNGLNVAATGWGGVFNFLNNTNNFTVPFKAARSATVNFETVANAGLPSTLGAGNRIFLTNANPAPAPPTRLQFTGTAPQTTNRTLLLEGPGNVALGSLITNLTITGHILQNNNIGPFTFEIYGNGSTSLLGNFIQMPYGSIKLQKSGLGTLTLAGNNNYSGGTEIFHVNNLNHAVRLTSNSGFGTGLVDLRALSSSFPGVWIGPNLTVPNDFSLYGMGIFTSAIELSANSSITGNISTLGTTNNIEILSKDPVNPFSYYSQIAGQFLNANSANLILTVNSPSPLSVHSTITGIDSTKKIIKRGNGTVHLSNQNSMFSGNLTIENGTISVNSLTNSGIPSPIGAGSRIELHTSVGSDISRLSLVTPGNFTTNRQIVISGGTGNVAINSALSNTRLNITTPIITEDNNFPRTLFFQGDGEQIVSINSPNLKIVSGGDYLGLFGWKRTSFQGFSSVGEIEIRNRSIHLMDGAVLSSGNVTTIQDLGGSLSGNGQLSGTGVVNISNNSSLRPGTLTTPGTLLINKPLILNPNSFLDWNINPTNAVVGSGVNDLVNATDLILDGTIVFNDGNPTPITNLGPYRLFNYSGNLVNNGLTIGQIFLPPGKTAAIAAGFGKVDLIITNNGTLVWITPNGTWTQPDTTNWTGTYNSGNNVHIPFPEGSLQVRNVGINSTLTPGSILLGETGQGDLKFVGNGTIIGNSSVTINFTRNFQIVETNAQLNYTGGTIVNKPIFGVTSLKLIGQGRFGTGPITVNHIGNATRTIRFDLLSNADLPNNITVNSDDPNASSLEIWAEANSTYTISGDISHSGFRTILNVNNNSTTNLIGNINFGNPNGRAEFGIRTYNEESFLPATVNVFGKISNSTMTIPFYVAVGGKGLVVNLLNNTNNFTVPFIAARSATVNFTSIADSGVPSSLGAGTNIQISNSNTTPPVPPTRLQYVGANPQSTNRILILLGPGNVALGSMLSNLTITGNVVQGTNQTFTFELYGNGSTTLLGNILQHPAGTLRLEKKDLGLLTLAGNNNYSGGTKIFHTNNSNYSVLLTSNSGFGTGVVHLQAVNSIYPGIKIAPYLEVSNNFTLEATPPSPSLIEVDRSSVLNGNITFLGAGTSGFLFADDFIEIRGSTIQTNVNNLIFKGNGSGVIRSQILGASNTTNIIKQGSGVAYFTHGNSSFSGNVIIEGGILAIGDANATLTDSFQNSSLGSGSQIKIVPSMLDTPTFLYDGFTPAITNRSIILGSANGNAAISTSFAPLTLTTPITQENPATTQNLIIQGFGNLTFTVAGGPNLSLVLENYGGNAILSSANSYGGNTTISGGGASLYLDTGATLNSTNIIVETLSTFGGNGTVLAGPGVINIQNNGILSPGLPGQVGTLSLNKPLILNNSTTLLWNLNGTNNTIGSGVNDLVNATNLTLDGIINFTSVGAPNITSSGPYRLFNYSGNLTNNLLTIGTIPLPPGKNANIVAGGGQVNLVFGLSSNLIWVTPNGTWTQPDATNWNGTYFAGDNVTIPFPTLPGQALRVVNITQPVSPGNVLIGNSGNGNLAFVGGGSIAGNAAVTINFTTANQYVENNNNFTYTGGTIVNNPNAGDNRLNLYGSGRWGNGSITINHLGTGSRQTTIRTNFNGNLTNNVVVNSDDPENSRFQLTSFTNATHTGSIQHNGSYTNLSVSSANTTTNFTGNITFGTSSGTSVLGISNFDETVEIPSTVNVSGRISNNFPVTNGYVGSGGWGLNVNYLNNTNNFTAEFIAARSATVNFTTIANAGVPSSLGAGQFFQIQNLNPAPAPETRLQFVGTTPQSTNRTLSIRGPNNVALGALFSNLTITGNVVQGFSDTFTFTVYGNGSTALLGNFIQDPLGVVKLEKTGLGTLTLAGNNNYSGGTEIFHTNNANYSVLLNSNTGFGLGPVTLRGQNGSFPGVRVAPGLVVPSNFALEGAGANTALIELTGSSEITGNITSTPFSVNNGFVFTGGNLSNPNRLSGAGIDGMNSNIIFDGSGFGEVNSQIYGVKPHRSIFKRGGGNVMLNNTDSSFVGNVTIENGTLSVVSLANAGSPSAAGAGSQITLATSSILPPALAYHGTSPSTSNRSIILATGNGTGVISVNSSSLTLTTPVTQQNPADPQTLRLDGAGNITLSVDGGSGFGLERVGTGIAVLAGANNYGGNTVINGGSLLLGTGATLNATNITVGSSGRFGGSGSVVAGAGNVTIANGGILSPGLPGQAGTLNVNKPLALNSNSILEWTLNATSTAIGGGINDLVSTTNLILDGTINFSVNGASQLLTGGAFRLFNYTGTLTDNGLTIGTLPMFTGWNAFVDTTVPGQVDLIVLVPEPGVVGLVVLGLGLAYLARRRKTAPTAKCR